MRKKSILLVLLLPILAAIGIYLFVDTAKLKPVLEANLSTALHRPVRVGSLQLKVWPPGLEASELSIGDDPAFSSRPFLTAASLRVQPSLLPLLRGAVEVRSLEVSSPVVELIQNAGKKWNYESMFPKTSAAGGSTNLSLAKLSVLNAKVAVVQPGEPRDTYSDISVEIEDYAEGKPFFLRCAATLPEGEKAAVEGRVALSGTKTTFDAMTIRLASLKGTLAGSMDDGRLDLHADIPQAPMAELAPLFLPKTMKASGQIAAKLDVAGTTSKPTIAGHLTATNFEVSGGEIRQPVRTPKVSIQFTPDRLTLEPASVTSGSTQLQASGVVTNYAATPNLDFDIAAPAAQIAELVAIARAYGVKAVEGVQATGSAKLQVHVAGSLKKNAPLAISGSGAITAAEIQAPALTKPLSIRNAAIKFEENSAAFSDLDLGIASTRAQGSLRVANFRQPALQFDLKADKVNLDELLGVMKSEPASKNEAPAPKLSAEGNISVGTFQLSNLTLTQLTSHIVYANNHAVLNPLNAQVYNGRHTGSMDIDLRANPPVYSLNSKLEKIESSQLLAAATSLKGILSGPLSGNLGLKFSPGEPVSMARSLNGNISLKIDQGRITTLNLLNELGIIAKFLGFNPSSEKATQFLSLAGDLNVANGTASTQNLKLDLANLSATLTGSMNLADQTLNLKLLSLFDKKFSDQVGGNRIGGFMTAALANSNGSLMVPASITGTFSKPVFAPDPAAIGKMKLQQFNPKDPKQMIDSVGGVLDLFRKKKPAEEQKP